MNRLRHILILPFLLLSMASCHEIEEWDNDVAGNFDALWTIVDEHYCFFQEKDIDWNEVRARYAKRLYRDINSRQLFDICAQMLDELHDGHVNLSSSFNTSYYRRWWSDYPQNFDLRLIQEHYLGFDYRQVGSVCYAILPQNIGYILYPSFSSPIGESNLDAILSYFSLCTAVIIDVRDNGGGQMTASESLVRRFISERILAGYMVNKTGPGHNDFAEPWPYYFDPADPARVAWHKPVVILTNRSTFSAANNFVSIMQYLPQVTIVGATTGGGSGMPMSFELPNGWTVRLSAVSVLDASGLPTEQGIDPTKGWEVDLDPLLALSGVDTMLEAAIRAALD